MSDYSKQVARKITLSKTHLTVFALFSINFNSISNLIFWREKRLLLGKKIFVQRIKGSDFLEKMIMGNFLHREQYYVDGRRENLIFQFSAQKVSLLFKNIFQVDFYKSWLRMQLTNLHIASDKTKTTKCI